MILLKPNDKVRQYQGLEGISAIEPPLWLSLALNLGDNVLIDAEAENLSWEETVGRIKELRLHDEKIIILPTGSHPSAQIQQMDIAEAFQKILNNVEIKNRLWFNPIGMSPRYDLLDHTKYRCHNWHSWTNKLKTNYGVVFTSINCPFSCDFCLTKKWYPKYSLRQINAVAQDFLHLASQGISNIKIIDELFVTKNKRVLEICEAISQIDFQFNIWAYARLDTINLSWLPQMKKAGINWLGIGIESGNDEIRKKNGKYMSNEEIKHIISAIKDNGICVGANYIFGFPDDTEYTMQQTLEFAMDLRCEYSNFYSMMAYPNTRLYDFAKAEKWELPTSPIQYSQYAYECFPLRTRYLPNNAVLAFRDYAFRTYYQTHTGYLKSMFGNRVANQMEKITKIPLKRKLYETI